LTAFILYYLLSATEYADPYVHVIIHVVVNLFTNKGVLRIAATDKTLHFLILQTVLPNVKRLCNNVAVNPVIIANEG